MDRFIENSSLIYAMYDKFLKSNMDRFIEVENIKTKMDTFILKSNMDRFIVFRQPFLR